MLSPNFFSLLLHGFQSAPSADNSQPLCIEWLSPILSIRYDAARVAAFTFPATSQATLLSAGAAIENVTKCCQLAGVAIDIVLFPEEGNSDLYAEVSIPDYERLYSSNGVEQLYSRHTNRFAYQKKP